MPEPLQALTAERYALEVATRLPAERILCTTLGRAQAARRLASDRLGARIYCWMLDQHRQRLALGDDHPDSGAFEIACAADPPNEAFDLALLPISKTGEAELVRDQLQSLVERLSIGGALVAAVDNPRDRWLLKQLHVLFEKVTVDVRPDAVVYTARKTVEIRRHRSFAHQLAFRDEDRLIQAVSRPGVFAHRRIDAGARQLLSAAQVEADLRVLDIGCGSGAVALALAARDPSVQVLAVDSHARAVQCTSQGAGLNGLSNVSVELNSTGVYCQPGMFDLALVNPPYYGKHRISELFVAAAHRSLKQGGKLLVVTKRPDWYLDSLPAKWREIRSWASRAYWIVEAIRT